MLFYFRVLVRKGYDIFCALLTPFTTAHLTKHSPCFIRQHKLNKTTMISWKASAQRTHCTPVRTVCSETCLASSISSFTVLLCNSLNSHIISHLAAILLYRDRLSFREGAVTDDLTVLGLCYLVHDPCNSASCCLLLKSARRLLLLHVFSSCCHCIACVLELLPLHVCVLELLPLHTNKICPSRLLIQINLFTLVSRQHTYSARTKWIGSNWPRRL